MNSRKWREIKDVLGHALDLPPERRASFLAELPEEGGLRSEVESLLMSFEAAGDFLDKPALAGTAADTSLEGKLIGPYRIETKIGDGGMGAVYRAVRAGDEFPRRVAIKLIRRGMDTDYIVQRFRTERQILAGLDHPNIARLLDGGATEDGLPYFVMEYIEGQTLVEYCDAHKLSTSERLILFRRICSAVHYAHTNLIVHRDLKPGNILVTEDGVPKLLDFGIAKLIDESHTRPAVVTQSIYRLMTPDYASPEQIRGEIVTTAGDVYSLGVVLFELLTGHRPYRITSRAHRDIEDTICRIEPERPSTAVNRVEEVMGATITPAQVGMVREGTPDRLRRRLRGDLDNIILMALRKDPKRRYASVEQFSGDIRKHLQGLPVSARKDTFFYRGTKFVGRHTAAVAAAILLFLTLVGGIASATWQAHIANEERDRAEHRFNDVRKLANSLMFELHDAIEPLPGSTFARELLVRKAQEYLDSLADETKQDPTLQRELALAYQKIGDVQGGPNRSNLGNTAAAVKSYAKALELYRLLVAHDPGNSDVARGLATAHGRMCMIYQVTGESRSALENCRAETALREKLSRAQPDSAILQRELATAYQNLGGARSMVGDITGARDACSNALRLCEDLAAADPADPASRRALSHAYSRMGAMLGLMKDYAGSLKDYQLALETDLMSIEASPRDTDMKLDLSFDYSDVGWTLAQLGNLHAGLENYRKALPIREALAAADPLDARVRQALANTYGRIGRILLKMGEEASALAHFRKQLTLNQGLVATDPVSVSNQTDLAEACANIAAEAETRGQWKEAQTWYRKSLDLYLKVNSRGALNAEHRDDLIQVQRDLARCEAALAHPVAPPPSRS